MNTATEEAIATPPEPQSAPPQVAAPKHVHACANCGAPMHGPFCYACGQPEKGMIRHLASVLSDVLDTVFNIDSRVFRSMFPLYFRPGYLTNEYFAGRRVRYVTPFRLFFFLCLTAFFAIQVALHIDDTGFNSNFKWNLNPQHIGIESAQTQEDVQKRTEQALKSIVTAKNAANMPAAAVDSLNKAAAEIQKKADTRLAYLKSRDDARAKNAPPPPDPENNDDQLSFDGKPWDPTAHPIKVSWLPDFANAKLNDMAARAKENIIEAKKDPRKLIEAVFSRLPWTLGILMPVFAVLLKVFYIFKRRLYMEHLMVALHSHAFIFMSLLLLAIVSLLNGWAATSATYLEPVLSLARSAIWIWLPIYLFLMQKRVYKQGWIMTFLKYSMIGICYTVIISFGIVGALLASLAFA